MLQKGDISAQLDSKASPMVLLKETWPCFGLSPASLCKTEQDLGSEPEHVVACVF